MLTAKRAHTGILVLGLMMLGNGCGDGEREVPPEPTPPSVLLGTGEAAFVPIEGEPSIELTAGFQGGFHVWVSFLAYGFSEERLDVELFTGLVGEPDTRIKLGGLLKFNAGVDEAGRDVYSFAGYPGQIREARCAHGKRVQLEVTLSDAAGRTAHDERHCIVTLPEQYRSQNCP